MVIAEMDIRKEILLAVAGTDYYPVVIQVIDDVERLRDRLGYLGGTPLFRVSRPVCSGKRSLRKKCLFSHDFNWFFGVVKKCCFKKTQRYVLFCSFHLLILSIFLYILFDGKSVYLRWSPSTSNTRFFPLKKIKLSRSRARTLL